MVHQVTSLPQLKLNLLYFSGQLDGSDLDGTFTIAGYDPSFDDLVVYAPDASFAGIDFDTAKDQAHRLVQGAPAGASKRRALVTANAMQGVLGRMFLGFIRSIAPSNFEIECFDNLATAVAWLAAGRTAFEPIDRSIILRALAELEHPTGNQRSNTASSSR
ncbi:MAG TPA: hypothetical protein VEH07_00135 [Alphaproteobacteria bacterium]|nr:hypothetical protein [Alphaproteobacteria bacterium]